MSHPLPPTPGPLPLLCLCWLPEAPMPQIPDALGPLAPALHPQVRRPASQLPRNERHSTCHPTDLQELWELLQGGSWPVCICTWGTGGSRSPSQQWENWATDQGVCVLAQDPSPVWCHTYRGGFWAY